MVGNGRQGESESPNQVLIVLPIVPISMLSWLLGERSFLRDGRTVGDGVTETVFAHEEVMRAHFTLLAINFASWKPDVKQWLHSEDSEGSLKELLQHAPCTLIH